MLEPSRIELVRQTIKNGVVLSERNPPTLFGLGLIDAVPDKVILDGEKRVYVEFPEIHGRASRLWGGSLGRFGWKAEIADLRMTVLVEWPNQLGLEVPGHRQPRFPLDREPKGNKLDLTMQDCDSLVDYVRLLRASAADNGSAGSKYHPMSRRVDGCLMQPVVRRVTCRA